MITVPYVEGLTEEAEENGYSMIGVWFYNAKKNEAYLDVFVFNPEESPTVHIGIQAGETRTFWAIMDAQVADLFIYTRTRLDRETIPSAFEDPDAEMSGVWQSSGAGCRDYLFWGGSASGCSDYMISAYRVLMTDEVVPEESFYLRYAIDGVALYKEYWAKHSADVFATRNYFSDDRTWFNADAYAKAHGCTVDGIHDNAYRRYELPSGEVLTIYARHEIGRGLLDYHKVTRILVDGNGCSYAKGDTQRVNGVRNTITMSGDIKLSRDQLDTILAFLTGTVETWY